MSNLDRTRNAEIGVSISPREQRFQRLIRWAEDSGARSLAHPAHLPGGLRGLAASEDISPGDPAISIPQSLIISEATATQSDLGKALCVLGDVPSETILLIWTMIDRHDKDSFYAPFWDTLPTRIDTGLTVSENIINILTGTHANTAFESARQHIREQYEDLRPILTALQRAYPDDILSDHISWDSFLWAVSLIYSYGMEVESEDGVLKQCLVPFASLINHSLTPHITRWGPLRPGANKALDFVAHRACLKGQQLTLSYGRLSNLKLLLFYGFSLPDNPHDALTIDFEMEHKDAHVNELRDCALQKAGLSLEQKLSKETGSQLLPLIRVLQASENELQSLLSGEADCLQGAISTQNEELVVGAVTDLLHGFLDGIHGSCAAAEGCMETQSSNEAETNFLKHMITFLRGQEDIVQSCLLL